MDSRIAHITEVVSLMKGEWLCYGGGHFNGWEHGHVTEVGHFNEEREWSCYINRSL